MMKKPIVRIENWHLEVRVDGTRLFGEAENHPQWGCNPIVSSPIVKDGTPTYVETKNTLYLLGEPFKQPRHTSRQREAIEVIKQAFITDRILSEIISPEVKSWAEAFANDDAEIAVRALTNAGLLVA